MTRGTTPPFPSLGETFARAMRAWEDGNVGEARRLARKIADRDPSFGGGHYLLGLIAHKQGLPRKAAEHLGRAVAADPAQPVPRLALGRALESQGDIPGAMAQYRAILAHDPRHAEANARLAELLAQAGQREAAIDHCQRAIAVNPRHAAALCCLGALFHDDGRSAEAAALLERALNLRPNWAHALYNYGLILLALDRVAAAVTILSGAIELRPGHGPGHAGLAEALRRLGRHEEAGIEAEHATRLSPQDAAGWIELGLSRAAQSVHDGAAAAFERAVALKPDQVHARWCLGEARRAQGQGERAAQHYRACLALDPDDRHGAALGLALLGLAPPPARAPDAYVRQLFDDFADRFETTLVDCLGYRGPDLIARMLDRVMENGGGLDVLDAGCGTGLAAPVLRPRAARLDGVDLSPRMIARARARNLYDRLDVGDLVAILDSRPAAYDLLVAADVLVYFGDLAPVLAAARRALRPGGLFAFTLERAENGDDHLGPGNRYAHAEAPLAARAEAAGFTVQRIEPEVIRREAGRDVAGLVVALRVPASSNY